MIQLSNFVLRPRSDFDSHQLAKSSRKQGSIYTFTYAQKRSDSDRERIYVRGVGVGVTRSRDSADSQYFVTSIGREAESESPAFKYTIV